MQPADLHTAVPAAPILVFLPDSGASLHVTAPPHDDEPRVLGLGLMQRTIMVAGRAGYRQFYFLARDQSAPPGVAPIASWGALATALAPHQPGPLIITRATVLAESEWLERPSEMQIDPATWAAVPRRVVTLAGAALPHALAALDADGGAYSLAAVEDRLTRRFGTPAKISVSSAPMVVASSADVDVAERRLLRGLVKDTDGFMARHIERPISLQIVRHLAPTAITPNQITLFSVIIGLLGAPFFLSTLWPWQTVGALLFLVHSILDGCDGELARLRFQQTRFGGVIDYWGDNVVHIATFACMAVGWSMSIGEAWPLLLGAAAALGSLGSACLVYWRVMRPKDDTGPLFTSVSTAPDRRLARLLDAASRRDFIYLVLILALFGKSNWFLVLASVGAPIFFFLLVFIAARERFAKRQAAYGT
ncbi:MAG TPA: CDP-alcohol phosphatidyltransferase family protein [Pseudolabrys sp.]|nr:CDP-alcohol phosphatidyltransferase family protein [Pseudolabrys sp.]